MENLGAKWSLRMMKIMWEEVGTAQLLQLVSGGAISALIQNLYSFYYQFRSVLFALVTNKLDIS